MSTHSNKHEKTIPTLTIFSKHFDALVCTSSVGNNVAVGVMSLSHTKINENWHREAEIMTTFGWWLSEKKSKNL